jgi:acyl-CoA synthetase (AMP-forming)/AMP-acid ligase II
VSLVPGVDPSSIEPSAIVDEVRTQLSSYKLPRQAVVVDHVPRAANGKADYPRAKQLFESTVNPSAG